MSTLQYATRVSSEGYVTPLPPEFYGRKVVVSAEAEQDRNKKKRKASAEEVQKFMDTCYGCLEGLSDEEFEQMKLERILGDH